MTRRLRLTVNYNPGLGLHPARWRILENPAQFLDINAYIAIAKRAEAAGFDAVFLSDFQSLPIEPPFEPWHGLDPLLALSSIAVHTKRIGLIATVSTTLHEPYDIARRFSSLDHISGGRAAWNIVTSFLPQAGWNFGIDLPSHEERYERAEEFVTAANKLWDSWPEGSLPMDAGRGEFANWDLVRIPNHSGKHFKVRGPLQVPPGPQGKPVIIQAGASDEGLAFGARHADIIYSLQSNFDLAKAEYDRVKAAVRKADRDPDKTLFLPGIYPLVASDETEAKRILQQLEDRRNLGAEARWLGTRLGIELDESDLDKPVDLKRPERTNIVSEGISASLWQKIALNPKATVREYLRTTHARNRFIVGGPEKIADDMEHWFRNGAADGFNVSATHFPDGLNNFIDHVVPLLKRRGMFDGGYRHATFRENLGLH